MLDPRFPPYSPGSRRLYDFEEAGEHSLLTAEVRRTIGALDAASAGRIAKGQLTGAEAARLARCWGAIAAELEAEDAWFAERARGAVPRQTLLDRLRKLRLEHGVAWADKVAALRRELEARRTGYEALVAKGQLTADQARQQLERLEAVHDLYWRHGYAFDGSRDELRAIGAKILDADLEQQGIAA